MESADRMTRSKEAEGIKTAFYRLLTKLKSEASEVGDKFDEVEENFKSIYSDYKRERAEYNKEQDALKAENLEKKKAIIEDLKALVEESSDASSNFPAFREIQNRWRAVGPVPASDYRDLNSNYQYYVEKFYDSVKISRELRDLDFKKNLEAKEQFCEEAESWQRTTMWSAPSTSSRNSTSSGRRLAPLPRSSATASGLVSRLPHQQ